MSSDGKVVQTELPASEYERLREVAEDQGKPLKAVVRDAIAAYAAGHATPDPDDPLFTAEPPAVGGDTVDATKTDDYLYGDERE
jgi:hypothetical protein